MYKYTYLCIILYEFYEKTIFPLFFFSGFCNNADDKHEKISRFYWLRKNAVFTKYDAEKR